MSTLSHHRLAHTWFTIYAVDDAEVGDIHVRPSLQARGVASFVYGRGDDWAQFPGRTWLETNGVAVTLWPYTEVDSAHHARHVIGCQFTQETRM